MYRRHEGRRKWGVRCIQDRGAGRGWAKEGFGQQAFFFRTAPTGAFCSASPNLNSPQLRAWTAVSSDDKTLLRSLSPSEGSGAGWLATGLPLSSLLTPSSVPQQGLWVLVRRAGAPEQGGTRSAAMRQEASGCLFTVGSPWERERERESLPSVSVRTSHQQHASKSTENHTPVHGFLLVPELGIP